MTLTRGRSRKRQARIEAFLQGLRQSGWTVGRNVQIDYRWGAGDTERYRTYAAELVALAPDVILANGSCDRGSVAADDPYRADRVRAGRRPGRRWLGRELGATGRQHDRLYAIRIQHQRENGWSCSSRSRPGVTRAAVIRDSAIAASVGQIGRDAIRGAILRRGAEPGRHRRRRRDRARDHCIRARVERRPDRDGGRVGDASSRADHRRWRPATACPRSIPTASSPRAAA